MGEKIKRISVGDKSKVVVEVTTENGDVESHILYDVGAIEVVYREEKRPYGLVPPTIQTK